MIDGHRYVARQQRLTVERQPEPQRFTARARRHAQGESHQLGRDATRAIAHDGKIRVDRQTLRLETVGYAPFVIAELDQTFEWPTGIGVRERRRQNEHALAAR